MDDSQDVKATRANQSRELTPDEIGTVSGGIAESPPPAHDTLVRPGDTKGIAL